jgi:hypothetical protein
MTSHEKVAEKLFAERPKPFDGRPFADNDL